MYALFDGNKQIGNSFPTEKEVWVVDERRRGRHLDRPIAVSRRPRKPAMNDMRAFRGSNR